MRHIVLGMGVGLALSASAVFAGGGVDVGVLTCKLTGVKNDIIYSKEEFACEFKPTKGDVQTYIGQIKSIGVDLSVTKDMTLVWGVLAPSGDVDVAESLKGDYFGGEASVALVAGGGANVLVGGGDKSFTLQPISVTGIRGSGVTVGISEFTLR